MAVSGSVTGQGDRGAKSEKENDKATISPPTLSLREGPVLEGVFLDVAGAEGTSRQFSSTSMS